MAAVCLETQDLCKTYVVDGYGNNVLQNVNLRVEEGEFVSIMGPSGSGKSTLLYVISGMDAMTAGNVIFDGEDLSKMSEKQLTKLRLLKMGFIFQQMYVMKKLCIMDNVVLPGYQAKLKSREEVNQKAEELLRRLGIVDLANREITEVARKISKNADDVTNLVKKLIDKASSGVVDFEPEIKSFYLNDLKQFLEEEYGRRLELLKIPYVFEVDHNAIMKSDKNGICRIMSQLMENAIKYGNGEGISVRIGKDAESYHISVRNKGKVLNERELPYVFNSFWRGSNAEGIEGSGIGLFEAYEIARRLDGDVYVRTNAELGEMEFHVVINVL